jgi:hypothetical protein
VLLQQVPGVVDQWIRLKMEAAEEPQRQLPEGQALVDSWVFHASDTARNHIRRATDRPRPGASPIRSP